MLKYIELNQERLRYTMIKKFKDKLTNLKAVLKDIEKLEIIKEQETNKQK